MSQSALSVFENSTLTPLTIPATRSRTAPQARVLHIINGEHFSGAERVQQLLGRQLPTLGIEAHFACLKPGKFATLCGLKEEFVNEVSMRSRFDLSILRQLRRIVSERNIDILHAHTPRTALITSLLALRTGLPWIYHVHSPAARDSTRNAINRVNHLIERYALGNCQRVITVSRSLRREMLKIGVSRKRLTVVPNGVPAIEPIESADRLGRTHWRIGMVALMRPRKGVEIALQAMQLLKQRKLPVSLELIGGFETDAYQQQVLTLLESLDLDDCVQCSGFTSDIPTAIRRLDALLLPSLFGEGMPMVILEALAAAVPVVATRVEGTPEVIRDGVEGYLAQPGNATSLADQLARLTSSRSAWQAMSARAVARHRSTFSDHQMAERVARVYRQLVLC